MFFDGSGLCVFYKRLLCGARASFVPAIVFAAASLMPVPIG
jgi:hypothetical protein